jgi:DNA repair exonuclease SbcCD ATPase subunit
MRTLTLLLVGAVLLAPAFLNADKGSASMESRLREALRATTRQVQELEKDLTVCKGQQAELAVKLQELEQRARAARASSSETIALRREAKEQAEANAELTASLATCQSRLNQCNEEAKQESRAEQLHRKELASLREELSLAREKNEKLRELGRSVIDWIADQGICSAILACEPFTGLWRAKLENVLQDYQDEIVVEKLAP